MPRLDLEARRRGEADEREIDLEGEAFEMTRGAGVLSLFLFFLLDLGDRCGNLLSVTASCFIGEDDRDDESEMVLGTDEAGTVERQAEEPLLMPKSSVARVSTPEFELSASRDGMSASCPSSSVRLEKTSRFVKLVVA